MSPAGNAISQDRSESGGDAISQDVVSPAGNVISCDRDEIGRKKIILGRLYLGGQEDESI